MGAKAEDSYQIQKARRKLKKQLEQEHRLITEKAISQMKSAMHAWLQRHSKERVKLQERLELFDENRHSVKTKSKFVGQLMKTLQKEASPKKDLKPLSGRIKK